MKLAINPNWLRANIQACINPSPILINRAVTENAKECNILNIKMCWYPAPATSKNYKLKLLRSKMASQKNSSKMMKNSKTAIDGTVNTTAAVIINCLSNLISGEALREFDELASQVTGTKKALLNSTKEGFLGYSTRINAIYNQKCTICRAMRKPQDPPFKLFTSQLT